MVIYTYQKAIERQTICSYSTKKTDVGTCTYNWYSDSHWLCLSEPQEVNYTHVW